MTDKTLTGEKGQKVLIEVTVNVRRAGAPDYHALELTDHIFYDQWDVRGLARILRRIKAAMDAERRIKAATATPNKSESEGTP